jgi:predicted TPR repeat methyltransferase
MVESEKFWDRLAEGFDEGEDDFEPIHTRVLENTKKYLNAGDVVLDYGCATGTKAFELASDVQRIQGIDIYILQNDRSCKKTGR